MSPGLRERKRLATSRAIQFAVLELSRDKGFDNVTVDEISRRADISPRTFFNYFPSKEAAVFGDNPFNLDRSILEAFIQAEPESKILEDLFVIMQSIAAIGSEDYELHQLRKLVICDHPQLLIQKIASIRDFEERLSEVIEQRLRVGAQTELADEKGIDQAVFQDRARLTALVAVAAMRHAWRRWADSSDVKSLPSLLANSFRELHALL